MYQDLTATEIISKIEYIKELNSEYQSLFDATNNYEEKALYKEVIVKNNEDINTLRALFKIKKNALIKPKKKLKLKRRRK